MLSGYQRYCCYCPAMAHIRVFVHVHAREIYFNLSADRDGLVQLDFGETTDPRTTIA